MKVRRKGTANVRKVARRAGPRREGKLVRRQANAAYRRSNAERSEQVGRRIDAALAKASRLREEIVARIDTALKDVLPVGKAKKKPRR